MINYKQYHTLGANGFIDKLYEEFMGLPISSQNGCNKTIDNRTKKWYNFSCNDKYYNR